MQCKICGSSAKLVKTFIVRKKYQAEYYICDKCSFMFVANPSWLSEAYEKPINTTDTGYVLRNVFLSRKTLLLFLFLFGKNKTFLDYGGGYGILTRLMRDYGLNYLWEDHYTKNLFAEGFEYTIEPIKALSCFECFEHLPEPLSEIERMLSISKNIFFSTVLLPEKTLPSDDWEYYGLNHGQHVAFYSEKTLLHIAKKYQLYFYTDHHNLHLLSEKKFPKWIFRFVIFLTKPQFDVVIRKFMKSKTVSDHNTLKSKGFI